MAATPDKSPLDKQSAARPAVRPAGKTATAAPKSSANTETSGANVAPIKGLGAIVTRNEFYRDGYRMMQKIALVQGLIILGLIGAVFMVIHVHQPENRYFATTEDGRLIPMVALNEPNLSTPALMSWVAQATTEVMTFGFHDYRRRLQESSRNFTKTGWASFTMALEKSRIIDTVTTNMQIVTAVPRSAPYVVSEGLVGGRYQWVVQMPMAVTYKSGAKETSSNLLLTLVVVRVPKLESPSGVGIEQWMAAAG